MKIIKDTRNNLLKRREMEFVFSSSSNPGQQGALNQLISEEKIDESLIVIKSIRGNYGSGSFSVNAFVYDSVEHKLLIEPKKKEKKK